MSLVVYDGRSHVSTAIQLLAFLKKETQLSLFFIDCGICLIMTVFRPIIWLPARQARFLKPYQ